MKKDEKPGGRAALVRTGDELTGVPWCDDEPMLSAGVASEPLWKHSSGCVQMRVLQRCLPEEGNIP